jgi:hypothetical protein
MIERRTMAQVSRRLLPLLFLLYLFCFLDRSNVGMASVPGQCRRRLRKSSVRRQAASAATGS